MKIVNETGFANSTKVFTDDGVEVTNLLAIESVTIGIHAENVVRATLVLAIAEIAITTNDIAWVVKNPVTKEFEPVDSIEFKDGTVVQFGKQGDVYARSLHDPKRENVSVFALGKGTRSFFRTPSAKMENRDD